MEADATKRPTQWALPVVAQLAVVAAVAVTGPTPHVRGVATVATVLIGGVLMAGVTSWLGERVAAATTLTVLATCMVWLLVSEALLLQAPPRTAASPFLWTAAMLPLVVASGYATLRLDGARVLAGLASGASLATYSAAFLSSGPTSDHPGIVPALVLALAGAMIALAVDAVADAARRAAQVAARASEEARWAYLDPLTGIPNRRGGQEALAALRDRGGAVVMVDVDHFKRVNDEHGHGIGDVVLTQVGGRIAAALRDPDTPVRWGGEEFLIVLPGTDQDGALAVAHRVHQSIGRIGHPVAVTASLGVATMEPDGNVDDLVGRADDALYRAKATGRDKVALDDWFGPLPAVELSREAGTQPERRSVSAVVPAA